MMIPYSAREPMNHTALRYLAAHAPIRAYLEIGVQEGHSLRAVIEAGRLDAVTLVDTWGSAYGGTGKGTHEHIGHLLNALKFTGTRTFLDGDSKALVPTIRCRFDLIHVDGDHSEDGARSDLWQCEPLLAPGGFLVLDDLAHPAHPYMGTVADAFTASFPEIHEIERRADFPFGVVIWQRPA